MPDALASFLGGFLGALIAYALQDRRRPIRNRFARLRLLRRQAGRAQEAGQPAPLVSDDTLREWWLGAEREEDES